MFPIQNLNFWGSGECFAQFYIGIVFMIIKKSKMRPRRPSPLEGPGGRKNAPKVVIVHYLMRTEVNKNFTVKLILYMKLGRKSL